MLAYSGRGRVLVKPIDVSDLVREISHLLEVSISKKAVLKLDLASGLPAVEADVTQIRQILLNLLTNASDALEDKSGVIALSTGAVECSREYLEETFHARDLPPGLYVAIEVSDTGMGMDTETVERMFDPFFTTKFAGRGLGLAAVSGIVRAHKGATKIYSEIGRGTTVKVLLPASEKTPSGESLAIRADSQHQGEGLVLLVDDEETVRAVTSAHLRRMGYSVVTASDGLEALEVVRQQANPIALILLDMIMPHMDGHEAFRQIRAVDKDVPVILMSGYTEREATSRFSGKGLAGFIQKPFTMDEFRSLIESVLEPEMSTHV